MRSIYIPVPALPVGNVPIWRLGGKGNYFVAGFNILGLFAIGCGTFAAWRHTSQILPLDGVDHVIMEGMEARPWQTSVIYQLYPRSFQDSDGDGVGDLRGALQRLPYLKELGVGIIWLNPIALSPMRDAGYDIADYKQVDPIFGTLEDMHALIAAAHKLGMRILFDFVPNHSSDQSKWFKQSRSSKTNPKRHWYVWNPGKCLRNGTRVPPNNWAGSHTDGSAGSAWTWDERTEEYYYHAYSSFQPDLNYRNPEVVTAMKDILRYWLQLGVDGFRVDAIAAILEDPKFRDAPIDWSCVNDETPVIFCQNKSRQKNVEGVHEIYRGWRRTVDEFGGNRVILGEVDTPQPHDHSDVLAYGTRKEPLFHVPFNFRLCKVDLSDAEAVCDSIRSYAGLVPSWAHGNWVLGSHDNSRVMERTNNDTRLTVALYVLISLLPGLPIIYYGDELAMRNQWISYDDCADPKCIENPEIFDKIGRDPARTPMQWDAEAQAGFSTNKSTWLPVNPNHVDLNVGAQKKNGSSPLSVLTRALRFRRENPQIPLGSIKHVSSDIPRSLSKSLVAVQYSVGDAFAVTIANLNTLKSITFDLLPLLFTNRSVTGWKKSFSSAEAMDPLEDVTNMKLQPGEVAVLAPGTSPA